MKLDRLRSVNLFRAYDNPALPTCEVKRLLGQLDAPPGTVYNEGSNEGAVCP